MKAIDKPKLIHRDSEHGASRSIAMTIAQSASAYAPSWRAEGRLTTIRGYPSRRALLHADFCFRGNASAGPDRDLAYPVVGSGLDDDRLAGAQCLDGVGVGAVAVGESARAVAGLVVAERAVVV